MRCMSFYIGIDFEVGFYPRMNFFIASIFIFNWLLNIFSTFIERSISTTIEHQTFCLICGAVIIRCTSFGVDCLVVNQNTNANTVFFKTRVHMYA